MPPDDNQDGATQNFLRKFVFPVTTFRPGASQVNITQTIKKLLRGLRVRTRVSRKHTQWNPVVVYSVQV
jgi:hypothetical protein